LEAMDEKNEKKYAWKNVEKIIYWLVGVILTTVFLAILWSVLP
jgi:hypothetical protein